jgi:tetratricopeptide (TPR) repeat protein
MREQRFDQGLRAKKLKGISEKVWEARINKASRLIFTYKKSIQPDTGKPQTYIAVQDICLDHDDVSRRARARKVTPDSQWLDAEVLEMFGNLDSDTISTVEQNILNQMQSEDIHIGDEFYDELLGNIQWKVVDSEEEWRQAIIEGGKDLSLKLTQQEYELATKYGNFLVMGSAGTGKTTVGLYRMVNSLTQLGEGKRLYVAASPILVKESEKCFKRLYGKNSLGGVFEFKTIKQLCFDILHDLNSDCNYLPECEVTYNVFEKWYYSEYSRYDRAVYPSSLVWHEIRGIIKGASLDLDNDYLSEFKYRDLGRKRSSVIAKKSDRDGIYKIAKRYKHFLEDKQLFDEIDLTRKTLGVAVGNPRYQMIICDEVQDFAELQLLLLVKLIASGGQLFFTGDLNQMILPSAFRWEDLTSILTEEKISYHQPEELNTNFRSVGSLSNLSNQILKLRCDLLREQSSKGFANVSGDFRDAARNINTSLEEISSILKDLYPDEAILVRTVEEKEQFSHLKFVFTIEEAKGLEFDTVFLVEFFTSKQNLWAKLLNQQRTSSNENVELRLEFNLLYVAITRARRVLNIWEAQKAALWNREEVKPFVQSITPELARQDRIEPTQQDWLNRGIYYRDAGFYVQSIECFEKAGDQKLKFEVDVQLLLQEGRYEQAAEILVQLEYWQQLAQMFESIEDWELASMYWSKCDDTFNYKRCRARNFESKKDWQLASLIWKEIGLNTESQRCDLTLEKEVKLSQAREVQTSKNTSKKFDETTNFSPSSFSSSNNMADDLHRSLCDLGIAERTLDGNYQATKALILGIIPGWVYDEKSGSAYRLDSARFQIALRCNLAIFDKDLEEPHKSIDNLQKRAEKYLRTGNMNLLSKTLSELQLLYPYDKSADIKCDLGNTAFQQGKYDLAANYFMQALSHNPYHAFSWHNQGILYEIKEDFIKSINCFNIALKLNCSDPDSYLARGIVYRKMFKYQLSVQDFCQALQITPQNSTVYLNRGFTYFSMNQIQESISDYTTAIKFNPSDAEAYYNRANVYWKMQRLDEAVADFENSANIFKSQGKTEDYNDSIFNIHLIHQGVKRTGDF